jgi:hypothetical protein
MNMSLRISRKAKLVIFKVALALPLTALVVLIAGFVIFDRDAWITSRRLSAALQNARSVVLVEYSGDIEIARKTATPDDISQLRNATSVWHRPFIPKTYLCFIPHHSIEIVRADGSELNCAICFLCGKFAIEERISLAPIPPYLAKPLVSFFTSMGMAPKTSDEYADIEISEHRRRSEQATNQPE